MTDRDRRQPQPASRQVDLRAKAPATKRGVNHEIGSSIAASVLECKPEPVALGTVEQGGIAPAGSTLEVLGEVALGDPHVDGGLAVALVDHQVGKMWSMTSKRDENLDFMSRGPRWNGPPPGGAPENSASPISFCSPIDSR